MRNSKNLLESIVFSVFLTVAIYLIILIINRDFPAVGHDYAIHIPRMLDTHLHHLINGLIVQWYTPSFGSGLPAYPDPLYIQYSLPQFLMFFVNPWFALIFSIIAYSTIGAYAFYLFLKEEIDLNWMSSALGAVFIVANGFYIEHMIVGHIGYQQFPLLGLILFAIFSKRLNLIQASLIIGATIALIINQAGFYLFVIFALSLLIILPLLYLMRPSIFGWQIIIKRFVVGSVASLLLSASKLIAVLSFMRFFPREIHDVYGKTYIQGLLGLITQLLGSMTFIPLYIANGKNINEIPVFFQKITGANYGVWETDISFSPVIFILLIVGVFELGIRLKKNPKLLTKEKITTCILLFVGIWLATDYSLAQGWLYQNTKAFPVIKSLHVNVRFASAFIFPASLLAVSSFQLFCIKHKYINSMIAFLFLSMLTILSTTSYFLFEKEVYIWNFNVQSSLKDYRQIEHGNTFSIRQIENVDDDRVLRRRASNLEGLNDAIFGYGLEYFHPLTETGSVFTIRDGYYNMTNPASYVYPYENDLYVFERFRVNQREELDLFLNRKQPHFNISLIQKIANLASLITLIVMFIYFISPIGYACVKLCKSICK